MKVAKLAFFIPVCIAALAGGCVTEDDAPEYSLGAGDRVPTFTVTLNDGSRWSSTDIRSGGAVIVFFNTDCRDCQRELPRMQQAYEESLRAESGPEFVCIAREEGATQIEAWWTEHDLTMPWSAQTDRTVYSLFASSGIPRIYVVNAEGIITAAYGPSDSPDVIK